MSLFYDGFPYEDPTVVHRRSLKVDGAGKPVLTPAGDRQWTVTDRTVYGAFAPNGSSENELQGTATDQPAVYYPASTDVLRTDTITIRGTTYQVTDIPAGWSDLGVEVRLQAVTGEPR